MENCLFCKIIAGEIPANKVYEDEHTFAFHDIHPQAPVHVLVLPRRHVESVQKADALTETETAAVFRAIAAVADKLDLKDGYRVIANTGAHACQTVPHLHFHILGGRQLSDHMG